MRLAPSGWRAFALAPALEPLKPEPHTGKLTEIAGETTRNVERLVTTRYSLLSRLQDWGDNES
jgi:hypothetical protein